MSDYPKYYRHEGLCIWRKTDTTGKQVRIPDDNKSILPLMMSDLIHPSKERFDEQVASMQETTKDVYEDYVKAFCGRVYIDIDRPMAERDLKKEIEKQQNQPIRR